MTSDAMARDYLQRARAGRVAVEALFGARGYADVVRECQDLVELVLKGALRFVGVEPPRRFDVHAEVEAFIDRFPPEWRYTLGEHRQALDRLAADRAPAFYGDEAEGVPASDLFGEDDALRAMTVADRLLAIYARLLEGSH
jgi:HEPN domain-containing protein